MPSEREFSKAYEKPPEQNFLGHIASEIWDHITGADQGQGLTQDKSAKKFLPDMTITQDQSQSAFKKDDSKDVGQYDTVGRSDNVLQKRKDDDEGYMKKLDYND
jgi:hypothetical protein